MIRPDAELLLDITNLHASVEDQPILKGVNLQVRAGEIHAVTVSYTHLTLPTTGIV